MSLAVGLVLVVGAALAQVSVLPAFSIFGAQPNLVIVLLVAWTAVRDQREALLLVPAAGFVLGLLDSQPLGLAMLALAPLILMTDVPELRLVESNLLPALLVAGVAALFYEGIHLLALAVSAGQPDWPVALLNVLVPAAIATALLLLPVYGVMRLTKHEFRRRWAF